MDIFEILTQCFKNRAGRIKGGDDNDVEERCRKLQIKMFGFESIGSNKSVIKKNLKDVAEKR